MTSPPDNLKGLLATLGRHEDGVEAVWAQALDLIGEGVVIVSPERQILYYSRGASEITGYRPEEVLGSICTEGLNCRDCQAGCTIFREGKVCHREVNLETRDGREVRVIKNGRLLRDQAGNVVGAIETFHDISDVDAYRRELADLAGQLEAERNLLEAFAETVDDGVATVDLSGRVSSLSEQGARLLGVAADETRGHPLASLFQDGDRVAGSLAHVLDGGGRVDLGAVRPLVPRPGCTGVQLRLTGLRYRGRALFGAAVVLRPEAPEEVAPFHGLVGATPVMRRLFGLVEALAGSDATVLVEGETGTGKEMVARALHLAGPRAARPFVAVSCAALTEALLESELFGHERGAFTGAFRDKPGRLELAADGTLFLDEVGCIPPAIQAKLLRVLEQREFERVGGTRVLPMRARLVAATNSDLSELVRSGDFREDLYYRLRVVPVRVPPLRERREDVPRLARHFAARNAGEGGCGPELNAEALEALSRHDWPGNVRELRNAVQYALATGQSPVVGASDLPPEVGRGAQAVGGEDERARIEQALREARYNRSIAANLLGMSRTTLWRRMRALGVD